MARVPHLDLTKANLAHLAGFKQDGLPLEEKNMPRCFSSYQRQQSRAKAGNS